MFSDGVEFNLESKEFCWKVFDLEFSSVGGREGLFLPSVLGLVPSRTVRYGSVVVVRVGVLFLSVFTTVVMVGTTVRVGLTFGTVVVVSGAVTVAEEGLVGLCQAAVVVLGSAAIVSEGMILLLDFVGLGVLSPVAGGEQTMVDFGSSIH